MPNRPLANGNYDTPFIINGHNEQLLHEHVIGKLSIKCIFNGQAIYKVEGSHLVVDDTRYLILNHAQPYDMIIESNKLVESFCIFFPLEWASDVLRNLIQDDDTLLKNPYDEIQPLLFYEIPTHHDDIASSIIHRIRHQYRSNRLMVGGDYLLFYELLAGILSVQRRIYQDAEELSYVRQTTRQEVYRRLHLAREFMMANLQQSLTITDLAQVAMMSPYHFLRRFSQVFGLTPHAYLTRKRLACAEKLLVSSNLSITDICLSVGFQSLGSFSTLFSKVYGVSPRQYRNSVK